jgi:hypothetical protein
MGFLSSGLRPEHVRARNIAVRHTVSCHGNVNKRDPWKCLCGGVQAAGLTLRDAVKEACLVNLQTSPPPDLAITL